MVYMQCAYKYFIYTSYLKMNLPKNENKTKHKHFESFFAILRMNNFNVLQL